MSRVIPEDLIDDVRQRADIVEVISTHVALKKKGQNYTGLCPFHQEKTPSFVVSPAKQIFHCFGCGKGGNVFSFLMEQEGLNFTEAVEKLALRYGISLPQKEMSPAQKQAVARNKRHEALNTWAMEYFQSCLKGPDGEKARTYLSGRGLDETTIERFALGYAPLQWDGLFLYLKDKGAQPEEMLQLGLIQKTAKGTWIDRFRDRVMFPILNEKGVAVGFGGRAMGDAQPKYLNSQDTPAFQKGQHLYALNLAKGAIRQKDQVVLMEGYMDVIAAHQHGITQAVATLGTALTQEQIKLLMRYSYQSLLCFDADAAGQKATLRSIELLIVHGASVKVLQIPEGKDPDDFLRSRGREAFEKLLERALTYFEYLFEMEKAKHDVDTMTGKVAVLQGMLPYLNRISSPVARQGYITLMAQSLSFPEQAIVAELRRHQKGVRGEETPTPQKQYQEQAFEKAQKTVLRCLLADRDKQSTFESCGGAELFAQRLPQSIYLAFLQLCEQGKNLREPEDLVALLEDPAQQQWLSGVLLEEAPYGEESKVYEDSILTLRRYYVEDKIKGLMNELSRLERSGDASLAQDIMEEISVLNKIKQSLRP